MLRDDNEMEHRLMMVVTVHTAVDDVEDYAVCCVQLLMRTRGQTTAQQLAL